MVTHVDIILVVSGPLTAVLVRVDDVYEGSKLHNQLKGVAICSDNDEYSPVIGYREAVKHAVQYRGTHVRLAAWAVAKREIQRIIKDGGYPHKFVSMDFRDGEIIETEQ